MGLFKIGNRPYGMINLELFSTLPLKLWLERELKVAAEGGAPIIASIVACPEPSDTQKTATAVVDTGYASMVEINVSCPMPVGEVGMHIGRDPNLVSEQVRAVKEAVEVPVAVKLSPNYAYIDEVAKAAEDAGADAISATNSVQSFYGVDIEKGIPKLPAFGGYSGPAVKPITMKCVAQIAGKVNIPISAIGGISTWEDVVEYIMVGATTVQTCTAVMWKGRGVFNELATGLRTFMRRNEYNRIEDLRGIALRHLTTVEELSKLNPMYANVDRGLCTECKICVKVCQYDAIKMMGGKG
jgi:dihydropyrimidine dehydrogenase (NAD+) subunit PreA